MLQKAGVEIFEYNAKIIDAVDTHFQAVEVNGERHTAASVLVAVGATPVVPEIEGIEHVTTSDSILEDIYELPERFVVVGAGYIGMEIASIMSGFGAQTTILLRGDQPLRGFDQDLRRELSQGLENHGVQIRPSTTVHAINRENNGYTLDTSDGSIGADLILYATGRNSKANTANLGLQELGVRMNDSGSIYVNSSYESNVKSVYSVGDCSDHAGSGISSGQFDLTPVAIAEGRALAEALFNSNPQAVTYSTIPTAIFSAPQGASVGMSESYATSLGYETEVFTARFRPHAIFARRRSRDDIHEDDCR